MSGRESRNPRASGRGVLIYWHVERKSMAIHSQLIGCSASEVAAMIEGVMRHGTTMDVEASYTDSHGQSEIGFGVTRLLGFDLLPRIKRINKTRLYRPAAGDPGTWPRLEPALTRPITGERHLFRACTIPRSAGRRVPAGLLPRHSPGAPDVTDGESGLLPNRPWSSPSCSLLRRSVRCGGPIGAGGVLTVITDSETAVNGRRASNCRSARGFLLFRGTVVQR